MVGRRRGWPVRWLSLSLLLGFTGCSDLAGDEQRSDAADGADAGGDGGARGRADGGHDLGKPDAASLSDAAADGGMTIDADSGADASVDTGDAAMPLSAHDFITDYIDSYCQFMMSCVGTTVCNLGPLIQREPTLVASTDAAMRKKRVTFHADWAAACLNQVHTAVNHCTGGPPVFVAGDGSCIKVFSGAVAIGGTCYFQSVVGSDECASGGFCASASNACPGKCTTFTKVGGSCTNGRACAAGSYCNSAFVCAALLSEGMICDDDTRFLCESSLTCVAVSAGERQCKKLGQRDDTCFDDVGCVSPLGCYQGKCVIKVPSGASCRSNDVCPAVAVTGQEICLAQADDQHNYIGSICGPTRQLDESCVYATDCTNYSSGKVDGIQCSSYGAQTTTTCMYPGNPGNPCDPRPCYTGSWCKLDANGDGVSRCVAEAGIGDPCGYNIGVCGGVLRCMTDAKCHEVGGEGEPCNIADTGSCESNLYCARGTNLCEPIGGKDALCSARWQGMSGKACSTGFYCACKGVPCVSYDNTMASPDEICVATQADGTPCSTYQQCTSAGCNNGKCGKPAVANVCDGIND